MELKKFTKQIIMTMGTQHENKDIRVEDYMKYDYQKYS